jgi:hypothetical protein
MKIERLPFGQSLSDKLRAAHYKWLGMPSGLTPDLAGKFMLGLHGGKTIKDMTDAQSEHYICSLERSISIANKIWNGGLKPERRVGPASSRRRKSVMF